jgi:undecaprenyl-diphosphatase
MFFDLLKSIILGIVEGITEFLPISSTGHLIIVNQWISFDADFTKLFDIVIQLGAILSVVVFFWNRLWPFGKDKEKNKEIWSIWSKTIVGVLPAIVIGALLANKIEEKFFNPLTVAVMLIAGGAVLIWLESRKTGTVPLSDSKRGLSPFFSVKDMTYRTAVYIGLFQCLAMIPGTSRSAATIIGAMLLGASRVVAAEFSFFLAIPTMVAASAYSLLKYKSHITGAETALLAVGFIVSFVVALAVIKFFMNYIQKHSFKNFGIYRIALGALVLLLFAIGLVK